MPPPEGREAKNRTTTHHNSSGKVVHIELDPYRRRKTIKVSASRTHIVRLLRCQRVRAPTPFRASQHWKRTACASKLWYSCNVRSEHASYCARRTRMAPPPQTSYDVNGRMRRRLKPAPVAPTPPWAPKSTHEVFQALPFHEPQPVLLT